MALTLGKSLAPGTEAPPFALPGVDGRTWSLEDFSDARALVVIITCNHCPYAKAYEDRFVALQREYEGRGVRLVAINPNDDRAYPEDSFDAMKKRAKDKGFNFPYLRDESQEVARAYDAVCTPDIYLFDAHRRLVCQTRFDDDWQHPERVRRRYLREAIEAVLAGEALPFEPIMPMGCSIKWKRA